MRSMGKYPSSLLFLSIFFLVLSISGKGYAVKETHLDEKKVQGGCGACHKGHGKTATAMLVRSKDELCFSCHGTASKGYMPGRSKDIYSVIMKNSSHPIIQTSHLHVPGERLPDSSLAGRRHASCFDCHNVHKSEQGDALKGLRGYSGRGVWIKQPISEYVICYNCHGDNDNPATEPGNVALDFAPSNPSFHPIERAGRNTFVQSLRKKGSLLSRTITCSDCHGNDDPSGPKGPHGSIYPPILKYRYFRTQAPESSTSYELCYSCHDRNSIIGDESFKAHKIHVVYNQISCAQCHDAHGSRFNPSLINFDSTVVFPNTLGEITFLPMVQGKPRCYLSCHLSGKIYEHKLDRTLQYCVNNRCPPSW